MVADIGQNEATGIFLRFPIGTAQNRNVSAIIRVGGGFNWSNRHSTGASIFVQTASTNPGMSKARTNSDGKTLGIEQKWILSGLGSEPMKPSHSSVTTKEMSILLDFEAKDLQRFIKGLMWPRPG